MSNMPTGGAISTATIDGVEYRIHTFEADGDFVIPSGMALPVEHLLVAGGGGGRSGAGGAGGVLDNVGNAENTPAGSYPVTVGVGGPVHANGTNSVFRSATAVGGGRGADSSLGESGGDGGSGGGGGSLSRDGGQGIPGQGHDGSDGSFDGAGTGGGAGGPGTGTIDSGEGGPGRLVNFDGSPTEYARGGDEDNIVRSGLGDGGPNSDAGPNLGPGADGVVKLRYPVSALADFNMRVGGATPDALRLGINAVTSAYLGSTKVWG